MQAALQAGPPEQAATVAWAATVGQGQVPRTPALATPGRTGRAGVGRTTAHGRSGGLNHGRRISGWGTRIVKSTSRVGNTVTETMPLICGRMEKTDRLRE